MLAFPFQKRRNIARRVATRKRPGQLDQFWCGRAGGHQAAIVVRPTSAEV